MNIGVTSDFGIIIGDINHEAMAMLHALPLAVLSGSRRTWEQDPVSGKITEDSHLIRADWREIISPELKLHCESQIEIYLRDLTNAVREITKGGEESHEITIPPENVESWYGALNQARLAFEDIHQFGTSTPSEEDFDSWPPQKQATFWQSRLYGAIQEALLFSMENQFGSSQ